MVWVTQARSSAIVRLAVHLGFTVLLLTSIAASAQSITVLYTFTGHGDGSIPEAGLTMDRAGNLYGTTSAGGAGFGTVFKLSHVGSGWILTTLYTFQGGTDGSNPQARVVFGPGGILYGTTTGGGNNGNGTVFNLRPPATVCRSTQCPWTETVLYRFTGGQDGGNPQYGNLIFDSAGHIYGTTANGGRHTCPCGVVFELSPSGQGWIESVLYMFTDGADGAEPVSGVTFDSAGNLYGTTSDGGSNFFGTAYELMPSESGWTETTLHSFGAPGDGSFPLGGVILDSPGNVYGTTFNGGSGGGGTVYELQPSGSNWNYSILYNFQGVAGPLDAPTMDASGNLYGTTLFDGADQDGSVFKLTPGSDGWSYTDLHDFTGGADGSQPSGSVTLDSQRNVYSTASGGQTGNGVAFEIAP